jgi:NAD+ diphosphatase
MVGFFAAPQLQFIDADEISYAEWFTRDQLDAKLAAATRLPGRTSIASRMIQAWRDGKLL